MTATARPRRFSIPHPRDYRRGLFKFKSTERAAQPTDRDLERIIRYGVPGTAMPAFDLLPKDDVAAILEYVKYLSMRGQTEYALAAAISDLGEDEQLKTDYPTLVEEILTPIADKRREANKAIIQPPAKPDWDLKESIAAGRELFYGTKANCVKCHGPSELGDGQTTDYDDWSKPLHEYELQVAQGLKTIPSDPDLSSAEKSARIKQLDELHTALADTTLTPARSCPATCGCIYRGGGRPLDLFHRIHAGINGVPMPGVGPPSPGRTGRVDPRRNLAPGRLPPAGAIVTDQSTPSSDAVQRPGATLASVGRRDVGKFWATLFLLVPVLGVACFIAGPIYDIWLPRDISQHGHTIDHLFYFILWLTGAVFVATEGAAVLVPLEVRRRRTPLDPVKFTHGSHSLGSGVDDPAGGHAAVHRHLSDERLGRRRRSASPTWLPIGRSHRPAVRVAAALSRAKDGKFGTLDDIHRGERSALAGQRRDSAST